MRIIGIDPGLQKTGWGIIDDELSRFKYVSHGVISTSTKDDIPKRLDDIFKNIQEIIKEYKPQHASVEEIFLNNNPKSTIKLSMARGIAILAPKNLGLDVFEYTANKVKKNVVGSGHAGKEQVAHMVMRLINNCPSVSNDAADALAIALCHAHSFKFYSKTA